MWNIHDTTEIRTVSHNCAYIFYYILYWKMYRFFFLKKAIKRQCKINTIAYNHTKRIHSVARGFLSYSSTLSAWKKRVVPKKKPLNSYNIKYSKIYKPVCGPTVSQTINGRELFSWTLITFKVTVSLFTSQADIRQHSRSARHTKVSYNYRQSVNAAVICVLSLLTAYEYSNTGKRERDILSLDANENLRMSLKWVFHHRIQLERPTRRHQMITGLPHVLWRIRVLCSKHRIAISSARSSRE